MTPTQKRLRDLRDRQSKERGRLAELAIVDALTDEQRAELDTIEKGTPDLERQIRAATVALETEDADAREAGEAGDDAKKADAETRERIELRGKASLGRFVIGAAAGKMPDGPEAELQQAAGLAPGQIPMELWDVPRRAERRGTEDRVITGAPGTVGVNLDVLRPMVFAPSIVDKLSVEMPMVPSGTYATGTLTTAATADAVAKSADVPETAANWTTQTTTPKRVGASLNLAGEDIAAVGQANFEAVLRQHISLVLSDELDDQMLNGDGSNDDLTGFFARLAAATAPGAAVASFDDYIAAFAGGIDGLWASMMSQVAIVAGVDTYRLSARTFRDATGQDLGDKAFADYAREHTAGWWTNRRMPAAATNIQAAILCRKGQSMMPTPMRTAVCPTWGYLTVDDIYTGARKGERRYVISALVGDVILVQPAAFAQVAFRVAV